MRPDDAALPLSIRLFGPFTVRLRGQALPHLIFRKSQWVLAWLALRDGQEVERDWLAGLLWPETAQASALHSLRNCLTDLRRALGPEAGRLLSPTPRTLALELTGAFVDVLAFDVAMALGEPEALEAAISLYQGPLLEGNAEAWAFQERQAREQGYLTAREKLAAWALERGDPAGAERHLRPAAVADPLRESTHRALMQSLAASGNYASALLCFRELRLRLHRELNTEPDPETKALFQHLRVEARRAQQRPSARARTVLSPFPVETEKLRVESPAPADSSPLSTLNPQRSPPAGENRLVTVLFADMSRSVETTQALDPEETAALMNQLLEIMVDAVLKFGGRVDRFLGDGALAVFGMPQAHEDDADRGIQAALEIREAAARWGYPVTAGISTGTVYAGAVGTERHRETTVVGPAVNLASRLQEHADPGQILIGEATYRLTRRAFEFSPRSLAAKGIARPVTAYDVARALARPEKARGIEGLRAPLIGREEELSKLRSALVRILRPGTPGPHRADGVRGQIVSLIGEAGVGKSRLIAELRAGVNPSRDRQGVNPSRDRQGGEKEGEQALPDGRGSETEPLLWLEGRCLELAATDGCSLFVDLLRHYFAWPADEDDVSRVVRIDAALRELAASGALSSARAEEIVPLLAALFSLRWSDEGELRIKSTEPEQRRQQTYLAIRDLLLALGRRQSLVLVLEDLHWADSLSLDLISLLMESLAQAPLFLLCSYRPDRDHRCTHLGTIAAQKCPESSTELRLRELTPMQNQQLVASLLGTPELPPPVKELVLDRSRGNPFFTEELVRALLDRGVLYQQEGAWRVREETAGPRAPESVQGLILSRVDRLEPELKRVLQNAAVIGRVFHRRLLAAVLDVADQQPGSCSSELPTAHGSLSTALWHLEERGLIYQERALPEEEYSFRHVLLQEIVYEGILRSQRSGLHQRVAEAIERLYGDRLEASYEQLAFHYERSGAEGPTQERALDYLVRAAERAHRTAAHREEAARLAQAIAMAERLGRRQQMADLHARRGMALSRNGRWPEAKAELQTALVELPPDRVEARAEILVDLANVCFWGVDAPRVRPYAREGMALAEAAEREDLAGTALGWLAFADQMDGELRAGVQRYEQAMKRAGGLRTAPVLAGAPLTYYLLGEYPEAVQLARQAETMIRGLNNTSATVFALSHLGLALAATGAYAEAMSVFEEARRFGIEHEVGHFVARAAAMSAGLHLDIYDFAGNEARAEEARELARQAGFLPSVVSAGIDLLLNYARRGDVGRTEKLVAEVTEGAAQVGGWHGWLWKLRLAQAQAEIVLARGNAKEAQSRADESIEQSCRRERVKYRVAGLITRGQALAAQGKCREALRDLQCAVELARPVGDPAMFLRAATALLALDGDGDLAAAAQAAAKRIAAALPDEPMRRRFEASEPVRLLGGLDG